MQSEPMQSDCSQLHHIYINRMAEADLQEVAELERLTFSHPWSFDSLQDALHREDTVYYVARQGKKLAGYCGFWLSYESADLCNIIVAQAFRGQKLASALYDQAVQDCLARGVEHILLEVRPSNTSAIQLYEAKGFLEISRRKKYYSDPQEDAIIMEKILP